jgi:hypothetical protein
MRSISCASYEFVEVHELLLTAHALIVFTCSISNMYTYAAAAVSNTHYSTERSLL